MKLFFAKPVIWIPLAVLAASACSDQSAPPAERPFEVDAPEAQSGSVPVVTLEHWRDSTPNERYAFLIGFVTMLEMEKEWQGDKPLTIGYSITASWVRGLAGKTLGDLSKALDDYIAQHPDDTESSVIGVLGRIYVSPALTPAEKEEARAHYRQIKAKK